MAAFVSGPISRRHESKHIDIRRSVFLVVSWRYFGLLNCWIEHLVSMISNWVWPHPPPRSYTLFSVRDPRTCNTWLAKRKLQRSSTHTLATKGFRSMLLGTNTSLVELKQTAPLRRLCISIAIPLTQSMLLPKCRMGRGGLVQDICGAKCRKKL